MTFTQYFTTGGCPMKKLLIAVFALSLITFFSAAAFAGGTVNKTNWSAEYIRTMNRNAATDYADIVFYNPAGTVMMEDGFYANLSAHWFPKDYNNKVPGVGDLDSDEASIVPGLYLLYKQNRWAGFFGASNVYGGGKVNYKNGNAINLMAAGALLPVLTSSSAKAESMGLAYMLGGAFKINELFSVSLGARFIDATNKANVQNNFLSPPAPAATQSAKLKWEDSGWGGIIGLNCYPLENLTLALRYETRTKLNFEYDIKSADLLGGLFLAGAGITDGMNKRQDHPATLAIGVAWKMRPNLRFETDLTYYYNRDADMAGTEDLISDGYDLGFSLEYDVNEVLKVSAGYLYTDIGVDMNDIQNTLNTHFNPDLDAHTVSCGFAWKARPDFDINVGIGRVFYNSTTINATGITYEKGIMFLAFGMQYKFN